MRQNDPRVLRTKRLLGDAVVRLILTKGYDATTIQDIAQEAGVQRATFYMHYKDKEELVQALVRDLMDDLHAQILALDAPMLSYQRDYDIFLMIFRHAIENADLYRALIKSSGGMSLANYLREYVAGELLELFSDQALDVPIGVLTAHTTSMKIYMVIWWLEKGMPYPPEAMAGMCARLSQHGIQGIVQRMGE
jgi:AcrR family transcriptional regulator